MLREVFRQLQSGAVTRREFLATLTSLGVGAIAAGQLADALADDSGAPLKKLLSGANGGQITCETLRLWGVEYVFGNTGSYETGFVDALVDYPDIHYVLGLHEGAVMAMADGFARITGRTTFVNVHSITGTANALGLIVNAFADSSPVVVSVGMSERSGENLGVFTETAKVETIPELFTKLAFKATEIDNLGESLRRAFRLASTLPSGPVFLGIPADLWVEKADRVRLLPAARSMHSGRIHPDGGAVAAAADYLASADNPLLIAGAELPHWGGLQELVDIADQLGAVVSGDTAASRSSMGFPSDHPRYLGALRAPMQSERPFDVVLIAGASRLSLARRGHPLIPEDARIIEIGLREEHLARNYPADVLIYAHAETTLAEIRDALCARQLDGHRIAERRGAAEALKSRIVARRQATLERVWDSEPIAPERLASEVDRSISATAVVVTEGATSDVVIWDYIRFDQPGGGRSHLISSGGSLGWGLGAAVGTKLGAVDRQVVALVGDGAYQFGVHALWTAKRFEVPLIVVIFNNLGYQANRWGLAGLKGRAAATGRFIGVSLESPQIDHVGIARSYGLDGERVERPGDLQAALGRAVAAEREGRAYVLDVLIDRRGGGADVTWHERYIPDYRS